MTMRQLDLAPVGNCAISSLVDRNARHVWHCHPRLDGDPVFNALVNGWSSAFNAMGKPQMSLMMTVIKMLCLLIPSVVIGAKLGGVMGIFWAISLVNIATGLGFHIWSRGVVLQTEGRLALKSP